MFGLQLLFVKDFSLFKRYDSPKIRFYILNVTTLYPDARKIYTIPGLCEVVDYSKLCSLLVSNYLFSKHVSLF